MAQVEVTLTAQPKWWFAPAFWLGVAIAGIAAFTLPPRYSARVADSVAQALTNFAFRYEVR